MTSLAQGSFARVWEIESQCDGRFHVSGEFPFKGQYSVEVTSPDLKSHALGSPFLVCSCFAHSTCLPNLLPQSCLSLSQITVIDPRLLIACATTTFATGHGLSVATAGKAFNFPAFATPFLQSVHRCCFHVHHHCCRCGRIS